MSINICVQDEQVNVDVAVGEINTGKPPVLQEISITKDGTYTPDYGVDGFSQVDVRVLPTDMLDGLEDGWDVMFYDEHKRGLASYSIKQGHTINPPVYECKNWQNADGEVITFPYTPEGDVIFYAMISTYADQLYEFYGVDKGVYPYLIMSIQKGLWAQVFFAKTIKTNTATETVVGAFIGDYSEVAQITVADFSDIESIVEAVTSKIKTLPDTNEQGYTVNDQSTFSPIYLYTNFECANTQNSGIYRVDV